MVFCDLNIGRWTSEQTKFEREAQGHKCEGVGVVRGVHPQTYVSVDLQMSAVSLKI